MISLSDLHDATLETVNFEWETGVLHLTLKTGLGVFDFVIVEAQGVTSFVCPRRYPWGPSSSVNSAMVEEGADEKILTIEMQSGDVLEAYCINVALKRSAAE